MAGMEELAIWKKYHQQNEKILGVVGLDEVGRGPLFGPVVSAAVALVFPSANKASDGQFQLALKYLKKLEVGDSKKLSSKKRQNILNSLWSTSNWAKAELNVVTIEGMMLLAAVGISSAQEIDQHNILQASLLSMVKAHAEVLNEVEKIVGKISPSQFIILADGNQNPFKAPAVANWKLRTTCLVKGDSRSLLVGLASLLAKEYRDHLITELAGKFPGYGLEDHAGYPTRAHLEALQKIGPSSEHRRSFRPVREAWEHQGG